MSATSAAATVTTVPAKSAATPLRRYATAVTAATFIVVGVSGVLMFFHVGEGLLMGAHQWLGMLFVAAAVFHVVRNATAFTKLMAKTRTKVLFAVVGLASVFFMTMAGVNGGGNPMKAFVGVAGEAPIATLAPVLGLETGELVARFKAEGISISDPGQSLTEIAKSQGVEPPRLFAILVK